MEAKSFSASAAESDCRYLCFSLDEKQFAIPLLEVKEVIGNLAITPIPHSPSYFKGVINLRGQVISIIDLRNRLKLGAASPAVEPTIIILDMLQTSLGVIVDSVDCVAMYEGESISPAPQVETGLSPELVQGVAKNEKSLTLILNMRALFGIDDLNVIKAQQSKAAA